MAKRPQENQFVACNCAKCKGKKIDQANWLKHNNQVHGNVSIIVEELQKLTSIIDERMKNERKD